MNLSKIEKLLQRCELRELYAIRDVLGHLIKKTEENNLRWSDSAGRKLRREERFETNLLGTLTRITDVRPGERKEYSVTIHDISRNGMCLQIDEGFIPSRVVEVMFARPGGKIKRCFLEVVRMQKRSNQDGSWLEIGCRSVSNEEVRRLRLQEERIAKMRSKLHNKRGILILLVGKDTEITEKKLAARIKTQQYNIHSHSNVFQALESAEKTSAQLIVFCQGSQLCNDPEAIELIKKKPIHLASLAIIEKEEDRFTLLKIGIDECLLEKNMDEFLFQAIERAMIGHTIRHNIGDQELTGRALIVSMDNTWINLISYQLEENGYNFRVAKDFLEAKELIKFPFDLILADFDAGNTQEFKEIREIFPGLPIIALCDDISHGHDAMANFASNYLCMPPRKDDFRMILESIMPTAAQAEKL